MKQPRLLLSVGLPRGLLKHAITLSLLLGVAWAGHFGYRLWQFKTLFEPHIIAYNFRNMPRLFDTNLIRKSGELLQTLAVAPTCSRIST